jgi:hypothetical protein
LSSLNTLSELETALSSLSHSEEAIKAIRTFSHTLGRSRHRLALFKADGALVRRPIFNDETRALGFTEEDDQFQLLQGDVISTEAAFFLGERISGYPRYVVLSSSCDLVPNRRQHAVMLRIRHVREGEANWKEKLNLLLLFAKTDAMYLPPLPGDALDVVCNQIDFDGVCQIRSSDLALANRIASLSLVGWRMFASFSRMVIARANQRECEMRIALQYASDNAA